ncbi:MAG: T9SS type A sorting domain-containing protein [Bacteroidota bacterium]|nr:T9SS type A sorting domain-containing protein [Bacteroidota bacterium]
MKKFNTARIICAFSVLMLILLAGPGFSQPKSSASETPRLHFILNMEKMIRNGNFNPSSDTLWLILTIPKDTMVILQPEAAPDQYEYYGNVDSGLDSLTLYRYIFRINDTIYEDFARQVKTDTTGIVLVNVWWNDDSIIKTTFRVNMTYAKNIGAFNPSTDFVDLSGTMNNWSGSGHMTAEGNDIYSIQYELIPGQNYEFKFRINGDTNTSEFPHGGLARLTRGPYQPETLSYVFNDYDPSAVPVTFQCNMWYQLKAGHFNDSIDYLDIAGNFNGNGAYDLLFDRSNDSIYTITKLIDTTYINTNTPLQFLFRFNGDWNTSEKLNNNTWRTYQPHDTAGGNTNVFSCWYDDKNPNEISAPWVYNVSIQGILAVGLPLSGIYTYEDANGDPEGISLYQWYYADDSIGTNLTAVTGADSITFVPTAAGYQKYVVFEVTPIAQTGTYTQGNPVRAVSVGPVGGLGIDTHDVVSLHVYPNPVSEKLAVESNVSIRRMEIFNLSGQLIMTVEAGNSYKVITDVSQLPEGFYILKCFDKDNRSGISRFIKN